MKSSLGFTGRQRASLLVSTAIVVLLGSGAAAAGGPPALPGSALQGIQTGEPAAPTVAAPEVAAPQAATPAEAAPVAEPVQPETTETQPAAQVPAERAAADDESARLASEVPTEDVAIPAAEWLNQEVGTIATRPVDETAAQAEPIVAEPIAAEPTSAELETSETTEPVREITTTVINATPQDDAQAAAEQVSEPAQPAAAPVIVQQAAPEQAAPIVRVESPKIVTIEADYRSPEDRKAAEAFEMKGPAALEQDAAGGKFALVWIDGSQRSGDTFVKFWKPSRQFFESGKECLTWARDEAAAGRAISPEGIQPGRQALEAGCFARDGSREYWVWRQASGAFTKTQLSETQFALFEEVARQWSVSSKVAYGEFPVAPYAGQ